MSDQTLQQQEKARELVQKAVEQDIRRWAAIIGLKPTHPRFPRFREDVTWVALYACMLAHIAEKLRRHQRLSELREDFLELADAAAATAEKLRPIEIYLINSGLPGVVDLNFLAKAAHDHADKCKTLDRGGPLRKRSFEVLADGLIRAYRRATGKRGTGRNVREGRSRLCRLFEDVLLTACDLAKDVTRRTLQVPDGYFGEHLQEIAMRQQKEDQQQPQGVD